MGIEEVIYGQQAPVAAAAPAMPEAVAAMPVPAAPAAAPAPDPSTFPTAQSTPEEKLGFIDRLRTDPNLLQGIMMTGMTMMQGRSAGENDMGLIGRSLMAGTQTKGFLDQNATEDTRKAAESQSQIEARGAQTAQTAQETSQKAELFPQTKAKLAQDLANARTDAARKKAELRIKEFEADPTRMADLLDLDKKAKKAQIDSSSASAGLHGAQAGKLAEDTKMRKWATTGTDAEKAQARAYFTVDDQATNATKDKNTFLEGQMKKLGWTDTQIAQRLLDINDPTNAKGDALRGLIYLANEEMDPVRKADYVARIDTLAKNASGKNTPGAPAAATPSAAGSKLPAGVPDGSTLIGTSGGKPVYQTPGGKQIIVK